MKKIITLFLFAIIGIFTLAIGACTTQEEYPDRQHAVIVVYDTTGKKWCEFSEYDTEDEKNKIIELWYTDDFQSPPIIIKYRLSDGSEYDAVDTKVIVECSFYSNGEYEKPSGLFKRGTYKFTYTVPSNNKLVYPFQGHLTVIIK